MESKIMPLAAHLKELRKILVVSGIALAASSIIVFMAFGDELFAFFTGPLHQLQIPVIATRVMETLMTKIKLSLLGGFILAFPVISWQTLGFVLPALHRREKKLVLALFPLSVLLFAAGVAFAYFTVFPLAIRFLLLVVTEGLTPMIAVREYLSFVIAFFIPFGLVFELPLAAFVMAKLELISPGLLARKRKYALLIIFITAAVLTPGPDIFSQLMMAVPMLLLYEVSILVTYLVYRLARKKAGMAEAH